jgi:hypothetical protein
LLLIKITFFPLKLKQQQASNESQLTLSNVVPVTGGKFSCEVSADFPSFHTIIVSGDMEVVGTYFFLIISYYLKKKLLFTFLLFVTKLYTF